MSLKKLGGRKPKSAIYRFNHSYIKDDESGCWVWQGKSRSGACKKYGRIKVNGVTMAAHRYSWELYNDQKIPEGMVVMHKCDNPECVNPDHLIVGTLSDNMKDMVKKGRNVSNFRLGLKGEDAGNSKLKKDQVVKIFNDSRPQRQIAKDFGITQAAVSLIKRKKTWSFIHD